MKIILVGCGPMAQDYFKVLNSLKIDLVVIGRGKVSAKEFENKTSHKVDSLNLDFYLENTKNLPNHAIVSVGVESLSLICEKLIKQGVTNILLEKPGALDYNQIINLNNCAIKHNSKVSIAYNRRFYHSIDLLKKQLTIDGGITSCYFDFTEWGHQIEPLKINNLIKENWLIANSTHIIDLVFHIIGSPKTISSNTIGSLKWHQRGAIFTGNGLSKNNVPFTYHANWAGPGRWSVEFITKFHKFLLCPIEKLKIVKIGSVKVEEVPELNSLDLEYKPGLYNQVNSFITNKTDRLCSLKEQVDNWEFYKKIANY